MIVKWPLLLVAIVVCLLGTLQLTDGKTTVLHERLCDPGNESCKGPQTQGRQSNAGKSIAVEDISKLLDGAFVDNSDVADKDDSNDIEDNENLNKVNDDKTNDLAQKPTAELNEKNNQSVKDEGKGWRQRLRRRLQKRIRNNLRRQIRRNNNRRMQIRRNNNRRRQIRRNNIRRNNIRRNNNRRKQKQRNRIRRLARRLRRRRRIRNRRG